MTVTDFSEYKKGHDAEKYRLLQAAALLKLFKQANGRDAQTIQEFNAWVKQQRELPKPIDPLAVLTDAEIEQVLSHP